MLTVKVPNIKKFWLLFCPRYLWVKKYTKSMEQSLLYKLTVPQLVKKFPHVLWNPQVHYHVHNSLSLLPIHSQITPVYILPSVFFIVHSNTNLPFTPTSSNMSFSFTFPHQNSVCISLIPHTCHMSGRSHPYAALKHAVF